MSIKFLLTILTVATIFLTSCKDTSHKFDPDTWYKETKQAILEQSNKAADSTHTENYDDGKPHKVKYFNRGMPTIEKWYRETGEQVVETHYSSDGKFELRREICPSGKVAFEGIFVNKNAYGLSTWWGCGEHKQEEGIRFNNEKVGQWKTWDSNGKESVSDYGGSELIDSLQTIKISI
ncbi:hypothetical protein [Parafilimonas sp.]|uniref:hypothetical protein n=1 Tax=Parafilimonas sp. TaxID=1969739 RepID=UPI003F7EFA89